MKLILPAPAKTNPLYHLSVDDVFDSLIEISLTGESLFDHWFFKYFQTLHNKFGTELDLYLFFQKRINNKLYTLKDVDDRVKSELHENQWIRFGPHALNYDTAPYNQSARELISTFDMIYQEIERFAGKNMFSSYVRLHFYSEMFELSSYFKKKGVKALFSTDRPVISYRLPEKEKELLESFGSVKYKGINFVRTLFRTEYLVDDKVNLPALFNKFDQMINQEKLIVFYAHETELKRKSVQNLTSKLVKYINSKQGKPFNSK